MKQFRLVVHQKAFSSEDVVMNLCYYEHAKEGDTVEIYDAEENNPRLLLQIKEAQTVAKDTISVEQTIANAFGLRPFQQVNVEIVNPADVALDSIELTFKDQYMGRSEMWRLKNSLTNTCVYINKKIEFCGGTVRCQVYEMWSVGDRVACGVITDDTKVVFRSSTSMVYLFLQMSSEMWQFDIHGDLYFEKAVNGFLADLFTKWKKNGSNHEVTIVLFSRTFYEAKYLEEFPLHMRECLQKDYKGRYYEDFYRVAVQNERYDDCSGILEQLRRLFSEYLKMVLDYHSRPGLKIPAATNSTAAQGNFLEVLNMSLNVFEKHYLDRSFDRTGQLSVVVTPGVGVFEVDRELTNITKQRIIDNGVGSDLVCVGEQPLHAVPLLKFHNKDTYLNVPDDYSMPHWINLSFYSTNKKVAYSNFIPRIKIPPMTECRGKELPKANLRPDEEYIHNTFFDYDAYDAQVFLSPAHLAHEIGYSKSTSRYKRTSGKLLDPKDIKGQRRKMSDPDIQHVSSDSSSQRSQPIAIPPAASPVSPHEEKTWTGCGANDRELSPPMRMVVGSEGSPPLESRALINPFDPSHVTIKLTSNRRRWTHIFPKGPTGMLIQQHHYQAAQTYADLKYPVGASSEKAPVLARSLSSAALQEYCKKRIGASANSQSSNVSTKNPKSLTLLWGATGEQEWTPALTTAVNDILIGVDWKSLTIPACLPITTDYFPDKRALQIDYVVSLYHLLPDDVNADYAQKRAIYKKPLTTPEVFVELISQRLAQGFQLIMLPAGMEKNGNGMLQNGSNTGSLVRKRTTNAEAEQTKTYFLSIGRLFHKISLTGNSITVTRYRPRHPYPGFNYQYRYRFHAPLHDTYEESYATFTTEKLEHYNWNYLDHYICTRGDTDFVFVDALKYWRFRIYLLPLNNAATKRIIDGNKHCDIYAIPSATDHQQMVDGFMKFIETIVNKFKRPGISKKPRMSLSVASQHGPLIIQPRRNSMSAVSSMQSNMQQCSSPMRERLGSNHRMQDRHRPRSGSKVMERGRVSPAVDGANVSTSTAASSYLDSQMHDGNTEDSSVNQEALLKSTATHEDILEAMKHPVSGVGFLTTHQSLPSATFVSADAANWLLTNMEGVDVLEQAVQILISMQKEGLICHASGEFAKPFLFGFYLYYIVNIDKDDNYCKPLEDLQSFENEWVEIEVRPPMNWGMGVAPSAAGVDDVERGVPHFLREDIDIAYLQGELDAPIFKRTHLEIDVNTKSDRVEWGHARYQTVFRPDQAYELVVEWLTASGSIVAELLSGWGRKAQQSCGLQMVPIPHDPLALPYSNKSDPLRGPIFVPLNTRCLESKDGLFKEFREDSQMDRLFLFQEAIVAKFGFIPCLMEPQNTAVAQEHQYIHCTGTVFILVTSPAPKPRHRCMSISKQRSTGRYSEHADVVPSPHEAYITRHVSGKNKDDYDNTRRKGFLWSWNHMVSRRWRTNVVVDNNFQTKLLRDFREFCANRDDRLRTYWEASWLTKEMASTMSKGLTLS
ncbi:PREDICTED: DEP domain-containing protein 5 isoform X2 [Nicrophorus vespilloides]|uniref:DEP domain-containing protein 5 isoform X2 n=1 Tax=Nicrophorus vespilloides TaxID=110193 RepID=A0ABM1N538_NICVS|nr:PREDICTED: DEP domain-containing protein 5 isoform X2 [Nicrophorus vespilloides]